MNPDSNLLNFLYSKPVTDGEQYFDSLMIPPLYCYLTPYDVQELNKIAVSIKLASNLQEKYRRIDNIMKPRGFVKFTSGTNRVVYKCLEDTRFVVKIALDRVGLKDNAAEFVNQQFLKPFVAKMFYVSPCGTVGFSERVTPITKRGEFEQVAKYVFWELMVTIIGKYVADDIGTDFFMNYGITDRGTVLLDYPYVYPLDPKKMFCTKIDPITNIPCNGEIDYDAGFNNLRCTKCGKIYRSIELRLNSSENTLIKEGGNNPMRVQIVRGDEVVYDYPGSTDYIVPPQTKRNTNKTLKVTVTGLDDIEPEKVEGPVAEPEEVKEEAVKPEMTKEVVDEEPKKSDHKKGRERGPDGKFISNKDKKVKKEKFNKQLNSPSKFIPEKDKDILGDY